MNRDPIREKIVQRLGEITDDRLFEACVCDLLRPEWPTLIPQPGGGDAGVDGAFTVGSQFGVLVATIQKDVIGNVTKNLQAQIEAGLTGKPVLVVTSQGLSPTQCRKIEARIQELGFRVAHAPYTRQAIADRLYHNSCWRKDLLGISGAPSALSSFPKSLRPFRDLPLLGRADDLDWLLRASGDCLIVGQPGVGKSFLCQALVRDGHGLFVIDNDIENLADAIRDQQPTAVIVEDAHHQLPLLERIALLRQQTGASFRIISDSWPGDALKVRQTLTLGEGQCRRLSPLSRPEIVELLKAAGIEAPPILIHRLIQLAMGLPGRAALLAHLCVLAGDARDVYEGTELAKWAYATFERLVGERSVTLLAGFAIGGDRGMRVKSVADVLGFPLGDVANDLAKLRHGGIVHDLGDGAYCILPEPLRAAIVRDKFFTADSLLPYQRFIEAALDVKSCIRALIGAFVVGANIEPQDLFSLVERMNDEQLWEALLWSDVTCAKLAVKARPDFALRFPQPCLMYVPETAVPALLLAANGDLRELHNSIDHPLRQIDDWIKSAIPGSGESVRRRKLLWQPVRNALKSAADKTSAFRALATVVTPRWETDHQDPANPDTYTCRFGCLTAEELEEIVMIWHEVLDELTSCEEIAWKSVLDAADEWLFPGRIGTSLLDEQRAVFQKYGAMILQRLAIIGQSSPAVLSAIGERARDLDIPLDVHIDQEFAILFPDDPIRQEGDWQQHAERQSSDAMKLVDRWLTMPLDVVAEKLVWCVTQAAQAPSWPNYSSLVAQSLAERVPDVSRWLDALLLNEATSELVYPCFERLRLEDATRWPERIRECLAHGTLRLACFQILLLADQLDADLEAFVSERIPENLPTVEHLVQQGLLSLRRIRSLLVDSRPGVSGAVASAIWAREKYRNAPIPDDVRSEWRQATISGNVKDHDLRDMLAHDAELAFRWLSDRIARQHAGSRHKPGAIKAACQSLTRDERIAILNQIPPGRWVCRDIVSATIGNDIELYRNVLRNPALTHYHLVPLRGRPDDQWARLATIALDEGIEIHAIAEAAVLEIEATWGSIPELYDRNAQAWNSLLSNPDPRIQQVASVGQSLARTASQEWTTREKVAEFWQTYN